MPNNVAHFATENRITNALHLATLRHFQVQPYSTDRFRYTVSTNDVD